jgi:hypothetical protein
VQAQDILQFAARHGFDTKFRKKPQLDRREQDFRRPEGHAHFHDASRG